MSDREILFWMIVASTVYFIAGYLIGRHHAKPEQAYRQKEGKHE